MPFEGTFAPLDLTYYDPVPDEMLPNDDLDIQVLWAGVLEARRRAGLAIRVHRDDLAEAFLAHVDFPFDEYGVAIRNMRLGLRAPWCGSYDNWFANGMGAAIRSEIWACLAAGDPASAAAYAREDACVDHAGPGIEAEAFFAALQALAFDADHTSDPGPIIEAACDVIDPAGPTARAVRNTLDWWSELSDWRPVRRRVIERWGSDNFTDTTQNVCFTLLGWLDARGDFGRGICTAVNCGYDTDCTGATLGALMGILNPDGIEDRWLVPIGRQLVVSPPVTPPAGQAFPATLDALTDQVLGLREALAGRPTEPHRGDEPRPTLKKLAVPAERAFVDWRSRRGYRDHLGLPATAVACPEMPADAERVMLPGTSAGIALEDFRTPTMLLRFTLELDAGRPVRLMFNSPQAHRVWLGEKYLFGRESGRMAPSLHRAPLHQWVDLELPAGRHGVTVAISRPDFGETSWVIGAGDPRTRQWLPGAFRVSTAGKVSA
jgi:ADP-ribosylglycohydrolase